MKIICKVITLSTAVLALCLAGCASGPVVAERFVWPPPPEEPKVEFLGVYRNQSDLTEKGLSALLLGTEASDSLQNPQAIAADGNGKVYVTDMKLGGVLVFDFTASKSYRMAGESAALLAKPSGIALDGDGNIYVGDTDKQKIFVFDKDEKPVSVIDLSAQAKSIGFFAIDKVRKRLAVPDPRASKVYIVDFSGKVLTTLEKYEGEEGILNMPAATAFDKGGNIIVADTMHARIVRFTPEGKFLSLFGKRGDNAGEFSVIKGVAVDSEDHIYVTDSKSNRFNVINEKGALLIAIGSVAGLSPKVGDFLIPMGIFIDQNDTIYIVDKFAKRFQKYQYLTPAYLSKHPILKDTPLAKPAEEEKKEKKEK